MKSQPIIPLVLSALMAFSALSSAAPAIGRKATLGQLIFFDKNLSNPPGQACGSCHDPKRFFTDPDQSKPTSEGVIEGRYGSRNAPTLFYTSASPTFHFDKTEGLFIGGQFVDGRAATVAQQARQPFLEPLEMNNADALEVVEKVRLSKYATLFKGVFGPNSLSNPEQAYQNIAHAIAAFLSLPDFSPMTSKYDYYLQGKVSFTAQERRGRAIFEDEHKGNCAACHPSRPVQNGAKKPLFTDFSYDNLGVPRNPTNLFYKQSAEFNPLGSTFVDRGLGDHVEDPHEDGKFKVPTLRNIEWTAPYMHNGYFKTLRGVVNFYNTRDEKPRCASNWLTETQALQQGCWPVAEITTNVNHDELGHLGLTAQQEEDLVAFLKTLTDGYAPQR